MSAPLCPLHKLEAVWKTGTSKKTGKDYAFWSCPIKKEQNGGEYCSNKFDAPKTNTAKFEQSLDAADSMNAQSKKDALITRTALAKSLIEAGKKYDVDTVKEFHRWLALVEGRAVKVESPKPEQVGIGEEELDLQSIPF